jgi:hypothetical protein
MKSSSKSTTTLIAFTLITLAAVGGARADVFPVATNPAVTEFLGGVAFDGTNYLVGLVSGTNMVGQRVSADGQLLGSPAVVGANPGFPPAAAMAGGKTNCLVAWSDYSVGSGVTMFGQIISPSSGPVGSAFPLLSSVGSHGFQAVQAAASDGTNFLVMWQDAADTNFYGQLVDSAGSHAGSGFYLFSASGGVGDRNVAAAFGKTNYLVAWQSGSSDSNHTYCELVSLGGAAGGAIQVSSTASLDRNPVAVGFDGTNYLVVWNRDTQRTGLGRPIWNLCGRLVSSAGSVLGNELVPVTEQASFPALAFDGDNYLLAWGFDSDTTNSDVTIHARFLDRSGSAIGPIFSPFPAAGTNPPLLPLNGVLFDGNRYLLAATYGSFLVNDSGDVQGFSGGDVYGAFLPRSTEAPVFTNATVAGGLFQGQLRVVPGQTYTIELSTNLLSWMPSGLVSSDTSNVLNLVDTRGVAAADRMFYRAYVGNSIGASYGFFFLEFASAGGFGSGFTPAPSFPVSLDSYSAAFDVRDDIALPDATNVFFTGPAGSGLTNAAADPNNFSLHSSHATYQSPFVSVPAAAPGGTWVVNYKGTNINFNIADPPDASHLVVPLPTVSVAGDVVQSVSWVYKDATTGATSGSTPAYLTGIQVEIDGILGGRIYDSPTLSASATSHALTSTVNWSNVQTLYMAYNDSLGNHYVVGFSKP